MTGLIVMAVVSFALGYGICAMINDVKFYPQGLFLYGIVCAALILSVALH